jgi:hypothetical protein
VSSHAASAIDRARTLPRLAHPIAPALARLVTRQRAELVTLQRRTAGPITAAFARARRQHAAAAIERFTREYGAALAQARAAAAADRDGPVPVVPLVWLHTGSDRLREVQQALGVAAGVGAAEALAKTLDAQRHAGAAGGAAAGQLLAALLASSTDDDDDGDDTPPFALPPLPPNRLGVSGFDGRALPSYFATLAPEAWAAARTTIYARVATGASAAVLAAALAAVLAASLTHALMMAAFETESMWRDAATHAYAENTDGGWVWEAQPDACDVCAAMHGTVHPASESLDSHPRCLCTAVPITAAQYAAAASAS